MPGSVNTRLEATLPVRVISPNGQQQTVVNPPSETHMF